MSQYNLDEFLKHQHVFEESNSGLTIRKIRDYNEKITLSQHKKRNMADILCDIKSNWEEEKKLVDELKKLTGE